MPHPSFHVVELSGYLAGLAQRCRNSRAYEALFGVSVAQDITADLTLTQAEVAALVYTAGEEDLEAFRLLKEAASDGLSDADAPVVSRAMRLISSSARRDHEACTRLS